MDKLIFGDPEARLGEMMKEMPKADGSQSYRSDLGVSGTPRSVATLAEAGIDKNLAKRARWSR
jgi:hypothetical protein